MKKLSIFLFVLSAFSILNSSYASELKNFHEIYNSLQAGNSIKLLINFNECTPKSPVSNLSVYTTPQAIMLTNNYLQFANSSLTTNHPKFPGKPVLENVTYRITNQNEVKITARLITLPDYSVVDELNSMCALGTAIKVYN